MTKIRELVYNHRKFIAMILVFSLMTSCVSSDMFGRREREVSAASKKPSVTLDSAKATSNAIMVKWKTNNVKKKSYVKGAQIQVSTKKSFPKAKTKTYKLTKAQAQKSSYKFTVKSKAIKKGTKYFFKIRLKVNLKWTSWSGVKTAKVAVKKKISLSKYKCEHSLAKGVTSKIVSVNDTVLDVHTYQDNGEGINPMFQVFLMVEEDGRTMTADEADDPETYIDYRMLKFKFDDGKSGELWDYLELDVEGGNGWIYSIPNYRDAVADVYLDTLTCDDYGFVVYEETVPHDVTKSYKTELYYDGVCIASQTRTKKACINGAISLFKQYGGEEYLQKLEDSGEEVVPGYITEWENNVFSYYGCQNGVHLTISVGRYYFPEYKWMVCDSAPQNANDINPNLQYKATGQLTSGKTYPITPYAPRYKQHGWVTYGNVHVKCAYLIPGTTNTWGQCGGTGSTYDPDKVQLSIYYDFYKPIYN